MVTESHYVFTRLVPKATDVKDFKRFPYFFSEELIGMNETVLYEKGKLYVKARVDIVTAEKFEAEILKQADPNKTYLFDTFDGRMLYCFEDHKSFFNTKTYIPYVNGNNWTAKGELLCLDGDGNICCISTFSGLHYIAQYINHSRRFITPDISTAFGENFACELYLEHFGHRSIQKYIKEPARAIPNLKPVELNAKVISSFRKNKKKVQDKILLSELIDCGGVLETDDEIIVENDLGRAFPDNTYILINKHGITIFTTDYSLMTDSFVDMLGFSNFTVVYKGAQK
jgi:hypothetical protein